MSRRVVAVRPDNNGDVLLAGPAIRALAAGADHVTLLCGPRGRAAAESLPGVDRVVCVELPWIELDPEPVTRSGILDLVDLLESPTRDTAVIFSSFHQSPLPMALVCRMAGVGFVGAISVDYPGALLDVRHRVRDGLHEVERALSLAAACGFELPPGDDGRLAVRPAAGRSVGPPWFDTDDPYVVVHPGATAQARAWDPAQLARTVELLRHAGWQVAVTGATGERDLTAAVAAGRRSGVRDLGGRTSWAQLTRLIEGAAALVVANTGPAHLAAAVGTPVVSLFAPTVPAHAWRPWKVPHVLLGDQTVGCAGCRARTCPFPGHPCLNPVDPVDVVAAVDRLAAGDREVVRA